jgi:Domain of unknown function (DUF6532)
MQIDCALDEWSSGTQVGVKFFASEYKSIFQDQLSMLRKFDVNTRDHKIIPTLQDKIYKAGWWVLLDSQHC